MRLTVMALAIATVALGQGGWERIESQAGRFTVSMPGSASESTQAVDAPYGRVVAHLWTFRGEGTAFLVGYSDYPPEYVKTHSAKDILDNVRDGAVENVQGALLKEELISKDGYPGRDVRISAAKGKAISRDRFLLVGRRLYQLVVVTPSSESQSAASERFFESFSLTPIPTAK